MKKLSEAYAKVKKESKDRSSKVYKDALQEQTNQVLAAIRARQKALQKK